MAQIVVGAVHLVAGQYHLYLAIREDDGSSVNFPHLFGDRIDGGPRSVPGGALSLYFGQVSARLRMAV